MSNSPLVTYTNLTKNRTHPRTHAIDTVTIHCIVGQWTAKQGCDYFANTDRQASANYVVGKDGSIGLSVDEGDRAWTSGGNLSVNGITGSQNDQRAITIEVASDTTHPYAITDKAMEALICLLVDICKRNPGIGRLRWQGDKNMVGQVDKQNMTVHRWFANKACPGDYLYEHHWKIATEVNRRLDAEEAGAEKEAIRAIVREVLAEELPKAVEAAIDKLNPIIKDLEDVPDYWKGVAKVLLETDTVNGGTPKEVNATDLNLRRETLKSAVIAVLYHENAEKAAKEGGDQA